jgi:adenosine deaminase
MSSPIDGPAAQALESLSASQVKFIHALPKAELHAHLNGCIPIAELQLLAQEYAATTTESLPPALVRTGIDQLQRGVTLGEIADFFGLFPAIYALTSSPARLRRAARAVLAQFLDGPTPQCAYLELRSTPRATADMDRRAYVEAVLDEVERYPSEKAALIVSLDRKMADEVVRECVGIACALKAEGRRVVGVDLCGDPLASFIYCGFRCRLTLLSRQATSVRGRSPSSRLRKRGWASHCTLPRYSFFS